MTDRIDLGGLASLAKAAKTGHWFKPKRVQADEFYGEYFDLPYDKDFNGGGALFASDETGAFVAAADPAVVLALVEAVEAAQAVDAMRDDEMPKNYVAFVAAMSDLHDVLGRFTAVSEDG